MKDRFNLEEDIMACWTVVDELGTVASRLLDGLPGRPDLTTDDLANILIGLQYLYTAKFEKLYDTFEQVHFTGYYNGKDKYDKTTVDFDIDYDDWPDTGSDILVKHTGPL